MENKRLVIVRGGGDIATGVVQVLWRAGFAVLILETTHPSAIRRNVALSEAVYDGESTVEDVHCFCCNGLDQVRAVLEADGVAMIVDPAGQSIKRLCPWAVVDAILAKRNLGTNRAMAPRTIALGPGFQAGEDVHVVIETMRGHDLGRLIYEGPALADTGTPGLIQGYGRERVLHSPGIGYIYGQCRIGDIVEKGQTVAEILSVPKGAETAAEKLLVPASLTGLVRGLIRDGYPVTKGFKIADIDPRESKYANCFTISDKARCLGGAVLTALLSLKRP